MNQINTNLTKVLSACLLLSFAVQCCAATTVVSITDTTADPGDVVTVPLMVNNVTNYGSGTIDITYNPSVVHVTGVTGSSDSTVPASNPDNTAGLARISALNSNGASGDLTFANVEFTAVGAGSSPLNIEVITLYDRSFRAISATVDNGLFTVSGDASTSPIPTSTTQSTSSSGGSSTGSVSVLTPTPSPTPTPTPEPATIADGGADTALTSESTSQDDGEADEETGTTSPTVKSTPKSQKAPGFEAVFAVIGLVIVALIVRRDNT